eukprot:m.80807 g.80807  ORF g.80807 m.80807 type:complete len:304 (+) comp12782_c0_seq1:397-1308(+)
MASNMYSQLIIPAKVLDMSYSVFHFVVYYLVPVYQHFALPELRAWGHRYQIPEATLASIKKERRRKQQRDSARRARQRRKDRLTDIEATINQYRYEKANVLHCEINKKGSGLDVGRAFDTALEPYTYEGQVKNSLAHGLGQQTYDDGRVFVGTFQDGVLGGGNCMCFQNDIGWFMTWKDGAFGSPVPLSQISDNSLITEVKQASTQVELAKQVVRTAWSPFTNYWNKYKAYQDVIMTVMLCAQRLRKKGGKSLPQDVLIVILSNLIAVQAPPPPTSMRITEPSVKKENNIKQEKHAVKQENNF